MSIYGKDEQYVRELMRCGNPMGEKAANDLAIEIRSHCRSAHVRRLYAGHNTYRFHVFMGSNTEEQEYDMRRGHIMRPEEFEYGVNRT